MQTSNTEEMVTISRAEYERFQEQAQVITSLTLQNEWLLEQLKLSKKKLFGRSSEQAEQMVMEQLSFTYVPAGTGIQSSGLEAVPADDGQLAAERLGEMAAAGLRYAARAALQGVGAARRRDDLAGAEGTGTFLRQQVLHVAVPHQRLHKTGGCAV